MAEADDNDSVADYHDEEEGEWHTVGSKARRSPKADAMAPPPKPAGGSKHQRKRRSRSHVGESHNRRNHNANAGVPIAHRPSAAVDTPTMRPPVNLPPRLLARNSAAVVNANQLTDRERCAQLWSQQHRKQHTTDRDLVAELKAVAHSQTSADGSEPEDIDEMLRAIADDLELDDEPPQRTQQRSIVLDAIDSMFARPQNSTAANDSGRSSGVSLKTKLNPNAQVFRPRPASVSEPVVDQAISVTPSMNTETSTEQLVPSCLNQAPSVRGGVKVPTSREQMVSSSLTQAPSLQGGAKPPAAASQPLPSAWSLIPTVFDAQTYEADLLRAEHFLSVIVDANCS